MIERNRQKSAGGGGGGGGGHTKEADELLTLVCLAHIIITCMLYADVKENKEPNRMLLR